MSVRRILISEARVALSRPGFDVVTTPSSYLTMALDTNLVLDERPLLVGVLRDKCVNDGAEVPYPTTYSKPPHVLIVPRNSDGLMALEPARNGGGSALIWQNLFGIEHYTDKFRLTRPGHTLFEDAAWNVSYDWHYVVMAAE